MEENNRDGQNGAVTPETRDESEQNSAPVEREKGEQVKAPETREENKSDQAIIDKDTAKKVVYSLCYLWGILFFLPLILYTNDAAARRHANEGLLLLLFSVVSNLVFGILTSFGGFMRPLFGAIMGAYSVLLLALGIIGIVYVVTDKDRPLPLIGNIHLIK